jgi:PAS domain-containing protein
MIKSVKNALPVVVAIMLTAGAFGLWMQSSHPAVLVGGLGAALIASLLFYAVIRWDEELDREEREKQQLADVVNLAMDAIVVCDATGKILYANRSARESYGLDDHP